MAEILCSKSGSRVFLVLRFAFPLDTVLIWRPDLRLRPSSLKETPTNSDSLLLGLEEATWRQTKSTLLEPQCFSDSFIYLHLSFKRWPGIPFRKLLNPHRWS
jgi:hypothetical protein